MDRDVLREAKPAGWGHRVVGGRPRLLFGWLEKLTPGLDSTREGALKRAFGAVPKILRTQNNNNRLIANPCTEFTVRLAPLQACHIY